MRAEPIAILVPETGQVKLDGQVRFVLWVGRYLAFGEETEMFIRRPVVSWLKTPFQCSVGARRASILAAKGVDHEPH